MFTKLAIPCRRNSEREKKAEVFPIKKSLSKNNPKYLYFLQVFFLLLPPVIKKSSEGQEKLQIVEC